MKVSICISKSFRDLFDFDVLKVVFALSLPIFLFYFGILFLFWDKIIGIAYYLISWVPFSVLKLNGAFFIMFFLWFVSVVVTFAIISAIFSPIFLKKAGEKTHYIYVISSIIIFSLVYAFIFITKWDFIYGEIQKLLTLLPFDTVSKAVGAILAIYIFYNLFILTIFGVIFFFAKPFLEAIRELEYPNIPINIEDKFKYKGVFFKDILLFIVLFILLFPLFFVPVINIGVQLFLWTKLYHDSFLYFICNEYCSNKTFEEVQKHKFKTAFLSAFAASFNFLPLINFFAPFFDVILFFHCIMQLSKE